MAEIFQKYASNLDVITTELNSLANSTGAAATTERDNTSTRYTAGEFIVELAAAGANTGFVGIYLIEGAVTGGLATVSPIQGARFLGSVQLNGTTLVRKSLRVDGISKFWKPYVFNSSGGALAATNNLIKFVGLTFTDV